MRDAPSHKAFFGDAEQTFRLTPDLILELERKAGAGIGAIARRVFAGDFRHADVMETIRLALIGGGMAPDEAHTLVATYGPHTPLVKSYVLAVAIIELVWNGAATDVADALASEAAVMTATLHEAL